MKKDIKKEKEVESAVADKLGPDEKEARRDRNEIDGFPTDAQTESSKPQPSKKNQ